MHARALLVSTLLALTTGVTSAEAIRLQWEDNSSDEAGFRIERATGNADFVQIGTVAANVSTFVDSEVASGVRYAYRVCAYNEHGTSGYSNIATNVPAIASQPGVPPPAAAGSSVVIAAGAMGGPPLAYEWQVSGDAGRTWTSVADSMHYAGAATASLTLRDIPDAFSGNLYRLVASNSVGSAVSDPVVLNVGAATRLANVSIRSVAGSGAESLIVGFVVTGGGSKSVLVRGIGPALRMFGVASVLSDPVLSLSSGGRVIATNAGWELAGNSAAIAVTAAGLGAFPLPAGSADAAILAPVEAGSGFIQLTGSRTPSSGAALVELYDAEASPDVRISNVSTRVMLTATSQPIAGFVLTGETSRQVLIRAVGPGLRPFGVTGSLPDPEVILVRQGVATGREQNDNWSGIGTLKWAFGITGAFMLDDASRDAALLVRLDPGAYTAQVSSVDGAAGVVLLEVYLVQ